jgi:hypothetical protein
MKLHKDFVYEQQLDPPITQMAAFPAREYNTSFAYRARILADKNKIILFHGILML